MHRFEEEEHEPVAVVRTLSDFALALTLIVLMLIGTRSAAGDKRAESHAAAATQGAQTVPDLDVLLAPGPTYLLSAADAHGPALIAADVAAKWTAAHPQDAAKIVLRFPNDTLAKDLHRALLDLQAAFGSHLARIDTAPQS